MTIPGPELGSAWLCRPQPAGSGTPFLGSALFHVVLIVLLGLSQGPQIRRAILARRPAVASLVAPPRPVPSRAIPPMSRTANPPAAEPVLRVPVRIAPEPAPVASKAAFLPALPAMPPAALAAAPKLLVEPSLPPMRETVKTGVFAAAAPPGPARAVTAQPEVKTGAFGTVAATAQAVRPGAVAASSFGDAAAAATPSPASRTVAAAGFGEASAARGLRETPAAVRSGGFAEARTAATAEPRGTIQLAGFKEVVASGVPKPVKTAAAEEPLSAVAILQKPRPAYTEEARALKVEGEVWLEILFSASGKAQILRVVKRLGHGLDESAIESAAAIRFRPAQRNGAPVDSIAIARITFQLAY